MSGICITWQPIRQRKVACWEKNWIEDLNWKSIWKVLQWAHCLPWTWFPKGFLVLSYNMLRFIYVKTWRKWLDFTPEILVTHNYTKAVWYGRLLSLYIMNCVTLLNTFLHKMNFPCFQVCYHALRLCNVSVRHFGGWSFFLNICLINMSILEG